MTGQQYPITSCGPSPHLTWAELACHDGTEYPLGWRASRGARLASVFETIRKACGAKPITVLSAYRTPAYNAACPGAATSSQHLQGRALDLRPPSPLTVKEFHAIILALAQQEAADIGGIGYYPTFVHVDIRPRTNGHLARWGDA